VRDVKWEPYVDSTGEDSLRVLVLLDEPTAQLDVRGEAEVFDKVLAATRQATTILISHRFSPVRHADRPGDAEHHHVVRGDGEAGWYSENEFT
jgi:ABC-type transport system involved in cytochrome bd biosynthesis fused ATPase/permease subunit